MKISIFLFPVLFILPAIFGYYEQWFSLNKVQSVNLSIALLATYLWLTELIPLYVTGFIILFLELSWLLPVWTEPRPKPIVFLSCYFSDTILLFLGGFVISQAISRYRLDERLAKIVLSQSRGSSFRFLLGIGLVTGFLSFWMNNTATAAMMLGLVMPMMARFPESSSFRKGILLLVPFSANLGGIATPVGTLPNVIGIGYLKERGLDFGFLTWMGFAVPVALTSILILILLIYYFYAKPEKDETFKHFTIATESRIFSNAEWFSISIIVITIFAWMTSDFHGIANGTIALFPVIVFFGTKLLSLEEFRSLSWDVLVLMGGGIALGKAMEETGLAKHFITSFSLNEHSLMFLFLFFSFMSLILSCFLSNTSVANLMLPITLGLPQELILPAALGATIGASLAMPFPISTPPNALAFGYGGIKSWDMAKIGGLISIVAWMIFVCLGGGILHISSIVDFSF
ncbi:SLC13 family permease [Leptospira ryugenii]|nr:DASS family sodium-coupled anion symporter [Leptospira ryugenii]